MVQRTTKEALKYFFAEHLRVLKNVCILKKKGIDVDENPPTFRK